MTINAPVHKNILFQILKDIYTDTAIAPFLGFKGDTAAFMFYELDRFSVDLDFDLLDETRTDHIFERMGEIIKRYGSIKESNKKRFSLIFVLSYEEKAHNIKIEINRRSCGSRYEIKTYLGVSMLVMAREDMFAHKLMAMYERIGKTNRDIYDIWFFLHKSWQINKSIVELRAKMPFKKLLEKCIAALEKMPDRRILQGIGELLPDRQKNWAKTKLRSETIFLLRVMHSNEK
jgi:predicted nucleotidyltransferase component of viral defense system